MNAIEIIEEIIRLPDEEVSTVKEYLRHIPKLADTDNITDYVIDFSPENNSNIEENAV